MSKSTQSIILRIPEAIHRIIKEIADRECRTMASVIRQAIKEYLERKGEK